LANHRTFRFGVVAAQAGTGDEWVAKARRVEELGYATLLIPDTLGPTLSPFPALAVAAAATRTLRVGTFVLANDYRNPVLVARESATLDLLSGGRFELGLGAGRPGSEGDYRQLGIPREAGGVRVDRLAESLGIITSLFAGQRVSAAGRHYAVSEVNLFPRPVQQPRPPILVAGSGKRLLSLAAGEADIVALGGPPTETEATFKEKLGWLREAAGERFDELELTVNLLAAGQQVPEYVRTRLSLDLEQLARSGSPYVLLGTPDQMGDQLLARRDSLGISYVTVGDELMEDFAPVVARLAGS
jgi:probable F420-dependent oxidoreductase